MGNRGTHITRLDTADLDRALAHFEGVYAAARGERLASSDFYERYVRGEMDFTFAMAWATFFEAAMRRDPARRAVEALPPVPA